MLSKASTSFGLWGSLFSMSYINSNSYTTLFRYRATNSYSHSFAVAVWLFVVSAEKDRLVTDTESISATFLYWIGFQRTSMIEYGTGEIGYGGTSLVRAYLGGNESTRTKRTTFYEREWLVALIWREPWNTCTVFA